MQSNDIIGERKKGIFNPDLADKLVFDGNQPSSSPDISESSLELKFDAFSARNGTIDNREAWIDYWSKSETKKMATLPDIYAFLKHLVALRKSNEPSEVASYSELRNSLYDDLKKGMVVNTFVLYTLIFKAMISHTADKFNFKDKSKPVLFPSGLNESLNHLREFGSDEYLKILFGTEDSHEKIENTLEDSLDLKSYRVIFDSPDNTSKKFMEIGSHDISEAFHVTCLNFDSKGYLHLVMTPYKSARGVSRGAIK
jgi:hypothetical protein